MWPHSLNSYLEGIFIMFNNLNKLVLDDLVLIIILKEEKFYI